MINNGKMMKRKKYFSVFLVLALLSTIFACWASVAGQEEVPGNSDTNTQETEIAVITADEADGYSPVIEDVLAETSTEYLVKISNAEYNAETGVISIEFENASDKDIVVQASITFNGQPAMYQSMYYGEAESIWSDKLLAGEKRVVTYAYEANVTDMPFVGVTGLYVDYALMDTTKSFTVSDVPYTEEDLVSFTYDDILGTDYAGNSASEAQPEAAVSEMEAVENFVNQTGFVRLFTTDWKCLIMIGIACVLLFLAIVKGFEPLLLLPIAFGMLLTNLPGAEMFHEELWAGGHVHWDLFAHSENFTPGLLDYLYLGVKLGIYPCLIFFGVGAMTDFEPLIANPKSLLLGAAAQLGIFVTYVAAIFMGFTALEASSIGIIGGADGPTAIFVTSKLAPHLLGPIAVAAYSYMALVPVIQPPIMKLLTTKKERCIKMQALRKVSKTEKIVFPIVVAIFVALLVPSAAPLIGSLMLGNLFKESGVTERLSKTVQNELMNIVTIFLGVTVGATATANTFLSAATIKIIVMGVIAFGLGTAGGVLLCKFMNLFLKNKINPLCGSAGVSAVPMAARVSQVVGQKENPSNFLLMHAMGPNVAGVIGSAIAAGVLIALFG